MTDARLAELDALPTEELRERAFARAREKHDLKFFWGLFRHLPNSARKETQDGWIGSLDATIDDAVAVWRDLTGHHYGDTEPLVRAEFIDYLMS